jgi:[ribosomal protein S18]-alanine N-acetyltransferase
MSDSSASDRLSLRPATEDDLLPIVKIEHKSYQAPWSEESLRAELTKPYSHFLVLTDDETDTQIAGYIVFWMLHGDCQILNVVVDLPVRGTGLAQRMIGHVVSLALKQGFSKITLDVRKSNTPAIQLYQKLKFSITQVRKAYYSNGEDAYQMTLDLRGEPIDF